MMPNFYYDYPLTFFTTVTYDRSKIRWLHLKLLHDRIQFAPPYLTVAVNYSRKIVDSIFPQALRV
jgi:hypothetical protein